MGVAICGSTQNRLVHLPSSRSSRSSVAEPMVYVPSPKSPEATPKITLMSDDDDVAEESETYCGLNTLQNYHCLLDGYLRTCMEELNVNATDHKLHITTQLIKTYYYPQYVVTPICNTLQSQNAFEFQKLFDLSYNMTRTDMIYPNNTQWHFKSANATHYISQSGFTRFNKINHHQNRIRGGVDIISAGICSTHTFIATLQAQQDDTDQTHQSFSRALLGFDDELQTLTGQCYYTQNIYYSQILQQSANSKATFFPLMNLAFIKDNDHIIDIKCGYEYCLFLTKNGIVWSRGTNQYGQIGKHKGILNIPTMSKIEYNCKGNKIPRIIDIECGYDNNLMIDDELNLWIFGHTSHGQLGIETYNHSQIVYTAMCHPYFKWNNCMIKHISCGVRHSLCIDSNGVCYLFGRNGFGEIGNRKKETVQYTPYIFQQSHVQYNNAFIVDGKCGEMHTVLLTESNDVVTFGRNTSGECSTVLQGQEAVTTGHVVQRKEEMGINEDDYIHSIIASKACTLVVVDMVKTRIMQITKLISS